MYTIQRYRIPNYKFPQKEDLKKELRSFSKEYRANLNSIELCKVIFEDNKNVSFLSIFECEQPKVEIKDINESKTTI